MLFLVFNPLFENEAHPEEHCFDSYRAGQKPQGPREHGSPQLVPETALFSHPVWPRSAKSSSSTLHITGSLALPRPTEDGQHSY